MIVDGLQNRSAKTLRKLLLRHDQKG